MVVPALGVAGIFWCSITACACGHFDHVTFAGLSVFLLMAWWLFLMGEKRRDLPTFVSAASLVLLSLLEIKCLADILWYGHEPLLRR